MRLRASLAWLARLARLTRLLVLLLLHLHAGMSCSGRHVLLLLLGLRKLLLLALGSRLPSWAHVRREGREESALCCLEWLHA